MNLLGEKEPRRIAVPVGRWTQQHVHFRRGTSIRQDKLWNEEIADTSFLCAKDGRKRIFQFFDLFWWIFHMSYEAPPSFGWLRNTSPPFNVTLASSANGVSFPSTSCSRS